MPPDYKSSTKPVLDFGDTSTVNFRSECGGGQHIWINTLGVDGAVCACGERRQKVCKCPDCDTLHTTTEPVI